jgi:iron complex transport system permease protein
VKHSNATGGNRKENVSVTAEVSIARPRRRGLLILVFGTLLILVGLMAVGWGSYSIPVPIIVSMIQNRLTESIAVDWPNSWETVIFDIRLPRVILATLVGAALSQAGVVFQGLFRNPLADPYLIGISSGAGLGATIAIAFGIGLNFIGLGAVSIFAFTGALLTTLFVYLLSRIGGRSSVATLILAGVALGAFMSSINTFIMLKAEDAFKTVHIVGWMMGSLALSNWAKVRILAPVIILTVFVTQIFAHRLNVLQLDEEQAQQLGIPVEQTRLILVVTASLSTAVAVSVSGVIGFVGLIVPHAVRLVWGPDHKFLLPMSALCGGIFMVLADSLARTLLSPSELPVGVITAFCGAPFFLYLLRRKRLFAY